MWYFSLARFIIGLVFLGFAAYKDLLTRTVDDRVWMVMGGLGAAILIFELFQRGVPWNYYLIFVPVFFLCFEALVERPLLMEEGDINYLVVGWFFVPIIFVIALFITIDNYGDLFWTLIAIPVIMLLAFVFYYFRILYGGADAKAMVILALLVPFYPEIENITHMAGNPAVLSAMEFLFPFTLVVLLNSAIVVLVLPVSYLFMNIKNGDLRFPQMFFGYKKKVEEIPDSFVWPMEYYEEGKRQFELIPRTDEEESLKSLREEGVEEAWVTPKIPFIVPMFFGFMLAFLIGNPILYLF